MAAMEIAVGATRMRSDATGGRTRRVRPSVWGGTIGIGEAAVSSAPCRWRVQVPSGAALPPPEGSPSRGMRLAENTVARLVPPQVATSSSEERAE